MNIFEKYFPELTENQILQLSQLKDLYFEWNSKINVVSRKDIEEIDIRHILHSLSIVNFIEFQPGSTVLDLGTGGGFPGIPLAIIYPEVEFHLVDSIAKKIRVVKEVASSLGLKNVKAYQKRVEEVPEKFDFVVSRAVARCSKVYGWTKDKFKKEGVHEIANGYILLKGGDLKEEINEFSKEYKKNPEEVLELDLTEFFEEDFFETKKIIYIPRYVIQ